MFVIRKEQLEAFRVPIRQKNRDEIFLRLQAVEGNRVYQEKDKIIVEDKKGRLSVLHYSDKNLLSTFTKPSGLKLSFEFDDEDRLRKAEFPGGEKLQLTYADDVPISITLNGAEIQLKYDSKTRLNEIVYPDRNIVSIQYNDLNQVSAIIDRVQAKQSYQSIIKDNRLVHQMKDALGRTTSLEMDALGGLERVVFPDNSTHEVRYDEILGAEIEKLRNGTERITYLEELYPYRVEWEDGNYQNIQVNESLLVGHIENESGVVSYEYDEEKRLIGESFQDSKVGYQYEDEYLKSIKYPRGLEVKYAYDEDDRLSSITVAGEAIQYVYAPNGTIAEIHYPNGLIEYQNNQVLSGLHETKIATQSGQLVSQQVYHYDQISRLVHQQHYYQNTLSKNWRFEYDGEGRLTEVHEETTKFHESFGYDPKGNIVQAGSLPVEVGVMDEVRRIGREEVEYDKGGNVSKFVDEVGRLLQLRYSDNNTLKFAKINEELWEYWYDAFGRRVGKSNGKESYTFYWSGEKLIGEEQKVSGRTSLREYIYSDDTIPIAFKEGEELYFLQRDLRGAITEVYDTKGKLVWQASYTAFGKANIAIATIKQPWRLAGQYYDEETGLHYNLARYYSPYLKTFLSLDPQWLKFEATHYSYAANDPFNRIDKNGNLAAWVSSAASIGAGVVVGVAVGAAAVALAPVAVTSLAGIVVVGVVAGGLGAIAESVVENVIKAEPVCLPCALKQGLIGAAFGAALGPFGKFLGKLCAPTANKLSPYFIKTLNSFKKPLEKLTGRVRGTSRKEFFNSVKEFRDGSWQMEIQENREIAEEAWKLWKNEKWIELEELFQNGMLGRKGNLRKVINNGWPPNNGFISVKKVRLGKGERFDRFGGEITDEKFIDAGRFTSPTGTPFEERAIVGKKLQYTYEVIEPIEVYQGPIIPWFGQKGGGIQNMNPQSINVLEDFGFIEIVVPK